MKKMSQDSLSPCFLMEERETKVPSLRISRTLISDNHFFAPESSVREKNDSRVTTTNVNTIVGDVNNGDSGEWPNTSCNINDPLPAPYRCGISSRSIKAPFEPPEELSSGAEQGLITILSRLKLFTYSIFQQCVASLICIFHRKRRHIVALLVEVCLIPLLFALVITFLQHQYTVGPTEELTQFQPYKTSLMVPDYYRSVLCYNASAFEEARGAAGDEAVNGIVGLDKCSNSVTKCSSSPRLPFPQYSLCLKQNRNQWAYSASSFLDGARDAIVIYNLNAIIAEQWIYRAAEEELRQESTSVSMDLSALLSENNRLDAIGCSGRIYFAPAENVPEDLIRYLNTTSSFFQYVYGGVFDTVSAARDYVSSVDPANAQGHWAIVVVKDNMETAFDIELQFNSTALPNINIPQKNLDFNGFYEYNTAEMYVISGFIHLQKVLFDYFVVSQKANHRLDTLYDPEAKNLPFVVSLTTPPEAKNSLLIKYAGSFVDLFICFVFLYPFTQMVKSVVLERELRIREATAIMGLHRTAMYISFFVTNIVQGTITSTIFSVTLYYGVTRKSDFLLVWLIFEVFYISLIPLSAFCAAFFTSARFGTHMAPIIYFAFVAAPFFLLGLSSSTPLIIRYGLLFLLSSAGFSCVLNNLLLMTSGSGFYLSDISSPFVTPSLEWMLIMMGFNCIIYTILMLYMDVITPGNFGPPRHPLFFLIEPFRYMIGCCSGSSSTPNENVNTERHGTIRDNHENRIAGRVVVVLDRLVKQFRRGGNNSFRAVDSLSWTIHNHEITVLLGTNGAGKSTTINMITGMESIDDGNAFVENYSVRAELSSVRQRLGYCPQHNILYPDLTCQQHLEFFARIKGLSSTKLAARVEEMLVLVDLLEKKDALPHQLSGGQKRKLSVAMAFVGDNSLVILDEPTAGMDAAARRHTWHVLRMMSSQCAILLTTHFLDEADLLGDHIGIMKSGKLQCSGSNLFLKSAFGNGYTLSVDLKKADVQDRIGKELRTRIPGLVLLSENAREKLFAMPKSCLVLPQVLRLLEQNGSELGVQSFSISATTLEEVFLNIIKQSEELDILSPGDEAMSSGKNHDNSLSTDPLGTSLNSCPMNDLDGTVAFHGSSNEIVRQLTDSSSSTQKSISSRNEESLCQTKNRTVLLQEVHDWWTSDLSVTEDHDPIFAGASTGCVSVIQRIQLFLWRSRTCLQCWAVLRGRFQYMVRDRKFQVLQLLSPVICTVVAMILFSIHFSSSSTMNIEYSFASFGSDIRTSAAACTTLLGNNASLWDRYVVVEEGVNPNVQYISNVSSTRDLESRMMSNWYSGSRKNPQYMGYMCNDRTIIDWIHYQSPTVVPKTMSGLGIVYNTSSTISLPVAMSELFHQIIRNGAHQAAVDIPTFRLSSTTMPNPPGGQSNSDKTLNSLLMCLMLVIPFTFLPSIPASWIVKERQTNIQHLQRLAGLSRFRYWLANFIFDFFSYFVSTFLVVVTLICFRRSEFIGGIVVLQFILGLTLYGLCSILMGYVLSFLFTEHATAQHAITTLNFITGFVLLVVICILDFLSSSPTLTSNIRFVFRVFPPFCIGDIFLSLVYFFEGMLGPDITPWSMRIVGWPAVYMSVDLVLYVLLISVLEHPLWTHYCSRLYIFMLRNLCCVHIPEEITEEAEELNGANPIASEIQNSCLQTSPATNFQLGESDNVNSEVLMSSENALPLSDVLRSGHFRFSEQDMFSASLENTQRVTQSGKNVRYSVLRQASIGHGVYGPHPNRSVVHGRTVSCVNYSFLHDCAAKSSCLYCRRETGAAVNPNPEVSGSTSSRKHRHCASFNSAPHAFFSQSLYIHDPMQQLEHQESAETWIKQEKKQEKQHISMMLPCSSFPGEITPTLPSNVLQESRLFPQTPRFHEPIYEEGHSVTVPCKKKVAFQKRLSGEDSDVEDERLAVHRDVYSVPKRDDPLQLLSVRKVYPTGQVAVRSLTFSNMKGEVFALLGTNGSGKSTTMSMICQAQAPTRGKIFVDGCNTVMESETAKRKVGYCPQFDATYDLLTVEEHLFFYADIHGIPLEKREYSVNLLMDVCGIKEYSDVLAKQLSGGNRRKLSVAISLVGRPSVVCLDEPSAGMDPMARRELWESILTISKECSVLLTTHHMEEVEALANCVGVMSHGTMRCIGGLPHLKRKYGSGYEAQLRFDRSKIGMQLSTWGTEDDAVEAFITNLFPGCVMNECFRGERYVLSLAEGTILSDVFEKLQLHQEEMGLTDFMISQTSIEQVFLRFCDMKEADRLDMGGVRAYQDMPNSSASDDGGRSTTTGKPKKQWGVSYRVYHDVKPNDIYTQENTTLMDGNELFGEERCAAKRESAQRRR